MRQSVPPVGRSTGVGSGGRIMTVDRKSGGVDPSDECELRTHSRSVAKGV